MKPINRRRFVKDAAVGSISLALANTVTLPAPGSTFKNIPVGIIGMDTSHSVAFTKYINSRENGFEVKAAYTTVSNDIPSSYNRVDKFTAELRDQGLQIVDSIDQLLEVCECILLETNDGRLHLEQAQQVFETGKRVFIDKPVAARFEDVVEIYRSAEGLNLPLFSSSGTRYMSQAQQVRNGSIGEVLGTDTYCPVSYEPNHSDLFWYGIHGVELLFTVMKTGCKRVSRRISSKYDTVIGEWHHGGIGTFRGILEGETGYGGQAFGTQGLASLGSWEGYDPLLEAILQYFRTGSAPVDPAETLEIYAFMEAARISSERNGDWVDLDSFEF